MRELLQSCSLWLKKSMYLEPKIAKNWVNLEFNLNSLKKICLQFPLWVLIDMHQLDKNMKVSIENTQMTKECWILSLIMCLDGEIVLKKRIIKKLFTLLMLWKIRLKWAMRCLQLELSLNEWSQKIKDFLKMKVYLKV